MVGLKLPAGPVGRPGLGRRIRKEDGWRRQSADKVGGPHGVPAGVGAGVTELPRFPFWETVHPSLPLPQVSLVPSALPWGHSFGTDRPEGSLRISLCGHLFVCMYLCAWLSYVFLLMGFDSLSGSLYGGARGIMCAGKVVSACICASLHSAHVCVYACAHLCKRAKERECVRASK